ncbi:MAG: tetratricopeptide repeat protein [Alphaproteobacteria bacterium]|nr:tetratricopeptide repeat protein [Alphaproteobacteria bacterium]
MIRRPALALVLIALAACQPQDQRQATGVAQRASDLAEDALTLAGLESGVQSYVAPDFDRLAPEKIAILPFVYPKPDLQPGDRAAAEREVTQTFRNAFSGLPYADVKAAAVREAMARLALPADQIVPDSRRKGLAETLGADAYIVGTISEFDKVYAGIYGQLSAGVQVDLVRASDAKVLWRARHVVRHHKGGVALSPIELVVTAVGTAMEVNDKARVAALDAMMRELIEAAPVPKSQAGQPRGPLILAARHSAERPLRAGEEVKLAVVTSRPAQVTARIGQLQLPLVAGPAGKDGIVHEVPYRFKRGEDVEAEPVLFLAIDERGRSAEFADPLQTLTVDSTPPDAPAAIRARYIQNQMRLDWTGAKAKDVVAYEIHRSATPRTGFEKIGETEFDRFADPRPLGDLAYYRVLARDRAGNLSDPPNAVAGRVVRPGPTPVKGVLADDTTWYAGASPYVLDGAVTVNATATLTVEPGTVIKAKPGAVLLVEGRLLAEGGGEGPIVWEPEGTARWQGIRIRNAPAGRDSALAHNRIAGADIALEVVGSSPTIRDSAFLRGDIGLRIAESRADPKLSGNLMRGNRIGLIVDASDAELTGNAVRFNSEAGIEIVAAAPRLDGNDLSDNGQVALRVLQQSRRGLIQAAGNYWGTVEGDAVRELIKGVAAFDPVLDAAPPRGKPVAVKLADTGRAASAPADPARLAEAATRLGSGYKLIDEGKPKEALEQLAPLAQLAPRNADLQYRIALLQVQAGNLREAQAAIERAVAANPFAPHLHFNRGQILTAIGDKAGAAEAFRKTLELNPNDTAAKKALGPAG